MAFLNRASFAVVVERDTTTRNAWAEVIRAVGLPRVLRRARPGEMDDLVARSAYLTAMVVGLSARQPPDRAMLGLVAQVRRQSPGAVILTVDHGSRPQAAPESFAAGADDSLRADHDPSELEARLLLRLRGVSRVDRWASRLLQLGLTPLEERIFLLLSDHAGEVVDRARLAELLGEERWSYGDRRFDVHIVRIRQKLEAHFGDQVQVRSIRSRGYLLEDKSQG